MEKVLILTVGGSHEPIVKSIKDTKADFVVFLCSDDSPTMKGSYTQITDKVEARDSKDPSKKLFLPNIPTQTNLKEGTWEIHKIKYFDDLNDCYQVSLRFIEEMRQKFKPDEIIADYTGGTKSMTAGLAAAALDDGNCKIILVAGIRSNLNKVTDKTEYVKPISHYDTLASKSLSQIASLLKRFDFAGTVNILEALIRFPLSNEKEQEIKSQLNICKGFDAWDRFDHVSAFEFLNPFKKYLVSYILPLERIKTEIEGKNAGYLMVEDLLLNAERRAIQGRYEDAIGRIYRAIELIAQIRLKTLHKQDTGNITIDTLTSLKEEFRANLEKYRNDENNEIKIGLRASYDLLYELNDIAFQPWYQENKNRLINFLKYRNDSLFAHGFKAIDQNTYEREVPIIIKLIRKLLDAIYKDEKRTEISQFPINVSKWQSSI
jgi:CRISPR-associated protein (TIGR02710 family)